MKFFLYLQENFFYICKKVFLYSREFFFTFVGNFFFYLQENFFIFAGKFFLYCQENFFIFAGKFFYKLFNWKVDVRYDFCWFCSYGSFLWLKIIKNNCYFLCPFFISFWTKKLMLNKSFKMIYFKFSFLW